MSKPIVVSTRHRAVKDIYLKRNNKSKLKLKSFKYTTGINLCAEQSGFTRYVDGDGTPNLSLRGDH